VQPPQNLPCLTCLGIRLEPELEEKLDSLAKETGRSKSYYARQAIRQYLQDREDYLKGIAALERREPTITLEELERRLGLDDGDCPDR
jgi:RHH-type transcriptional regulator, rel operon repressor / antitoxin RelB